jgi:dethiobiotin synthetase
VTGTDTAVGKTLVAAGLLLAAGNRGCRSAGIKPVAAGSTIGGESGGGESGHDRLTNDDALALQTASNVTLDYDLVNPFPLQPPIAPHIAAARAGIELTVADLVGHFNALRQYDVDFMIVEGAGGWLVPINESETLADLCVALKMPAILVVGLRLGCLNHALLTAETMRRSGVEMAGWVANCIDPEMAARDENQQSLRDRLPGPCLGIVPFLGSGLIDEDIEAFLDIDRLLT